MVDFLKIKIHALFSGKLVKMSKNIHPSYDEVSRQLIKKVGEKMDLPVFTDPHRCPKGAFLVHVPFFHHVLWKPPVFLCNSTYKATNKQTNRQKWKHNLRGRGNNQTFVSQFDLRVMILYNVFLLMVQKT